MHIETTPASNWKGKNRNLFSSQQLPINHWFPLFMMMNVKRSTAICILFCFIRKLNFSACFPWYLNWLNLSAFSVKCRPLPEQYSERTVEPNSIWILVDLMRKINWAASLSHAHLSTQKMCCYHITSRKCRDNSAQPSSEMVPRFCATFSVVLQPPKESLVLIPLLR